MNSSETEAGLPRRSLFCSNDGSLLHCPYVDEYGAPVQRTRQTHPYNYDRFVQERCGENSEVNGNIYSDRLLMDDYDLTRALLIKHFKDTGIDGGGDDYRHRPARAIEAFLRERLKQPHLRLILVMESCNVASGQPLWDFGYHIPNLT